MPPIFTNEDGANVAPNEVAIANEDGANVAPNEVATLMVDSNFMREDIESSPTKIMQGIIGEICPCEQVK